eukprot:SAG31_NODE_11737_length_1002_cov_1.107420_1_plen_298_part_01
MEEGSNDKPSMSPMERIRTTQARLDALAALRNNIAEVHRAGVGGLQHQHTQQQSQRAQSSFAPPVVPPVDYQGSSARPRHTASVATHSRHRVPTSPWQSGVSAAASQGNAVSQAMDVESDQVRSGERAISAGSTALAASAPAPAPLIGLSQRLQQIASNDGTSVDIAPPANQDNPYRASFQPLPPPTSIWTGVPRIGAGAGASVVGGNNSGAMVPSAVSFAPPSPGLRQLVPGIGELAQLVQRLQPVCKVDHYTDPLLQCNGRPSTYAWFQVKKGMRKTLLWAHRRVGVAVGVGGWQM